MAIFEWDNTYSVNHYEIDSHHKKLFDILNRLYDLMAAGADDNGIIRIIAELLDYTNYHFSEEEKIMQQVNYPELNIHKQHHRDFISKLEEFQNDAKNGKAIFVAIKVADIGISWLKEHILTVDARYKTYVEKIA